MTDDIAKGLRGREPMGLLFFGNPGCGKTFLAKGIAGSVPNTTFIEIKMSNILSSYKGTSEQTATAILDVGEIFGPSIVYMGKFISTK